MTDKLTEEELEKIAGGTKIAGDLDAEVEVITKTPNVYETCPVCCCQRCGTTMLKKITYTDTSLGMKLWSETRHVWICGTCGLERSY